MYILKQKPELRPVCRAIQEFTAVDQRIKEREKMASLPPASFCLPSLLPTHPRDMKWICLGEPIIFHHVGRLGTGNSGMAPAATAVQ